jgi:hypothetical protein
MAPKDIPPAHVIVCRAGATLRKDQLHQLYIHFFYKRHDEFWHHKAMEKLPAILSASDMLVCGEDLGMVPHCVPPVMHQLDILSLEIQRMPKDPESQICQSGRCPLSLGLYDVHTRYADHHGDGGRQTPNPLSRFTTNELGHTRVPLPIFAEPWICRQIIAQHLHSPAMWTTFPHSGSAGDGRRPPMGTRRTRNRLTSPAMSGIYGGTGCIRASMTCKMQPSLIKPSWR